MEKHIHPGHGGDEPPPPCVRSYRPVSVVRWCGSTRLVINFALVVEQSLGFTRKFARLWVLKNIRKERPTRWRVSFRIVKLTQITAEGDQPWKSKELARRVRPRGQLTGLRA